MAVSKTQNERPAINALIDLANSLEIDTQSQEILIENLGEALSDEIGNRRDADDTISGLIEDEKEEREDADELIQNQIGDGFTSESTITSFATYAAESISDLTSFMNSINTSLKFGFGDEITIAANDDYSDVIVYESPFPESSDSFAFIALPNDIDQEQLSVALKRVTNIGLSYSVTNSDSDPITLKIGYLAICIPTIQ